MCSTRKHIFDIAWYIFDVAYATAYLAQKTIFFCLIKKLTKTFPPMFSTKITIYMPGRK